MKDKIAFNSSEKITIKLKEYEQAQDMIKHDNTLAWQIGSILITGTLILTGLVFNGNTIQEMKTNIWIAWVITLAVPAISLLTLSVWYQWLYRYQTYIKVRHEVMHIIEGELGMYHYLRVAEAHIDEIMSDNNTERQKKELKALGKTASDIDNKTNEEIWPDLYAAKTQAAAMFPQSINNPLYTGVVLGGKKGLALARTLTIGIPFIQFLVLCSMSIGFQTLRVLPYVG